MLNIKLRKKQIDEIMYALGYLPEKGLAYKSVIGRQDITVPNCLTLLAFIHWITKLCDRRACSAGVEWGISIGKMKAK